jgi:hypothetical protein
MILRTLVLTNDKHNRIDIQTAADMCIKIATSEPNNFTAVELTQNEVDELILILSEAKNEARNWCE